MSFHELPRNTPRHQRHNWQRVGRATRRRQLACEPLEVRALLAADFPQFVDPHPSAGNQFGQTVVPLSTGNVVITAPRDDAGGNNAGAVYLFNGANGALISTLIGSSEGDLIGGTGVVALASGNFVVLSPDWDFGSNVDAGAATFGNGTTGVSGVVGPENSLVGNNAGDRVGVDVRALTNGNYVVMSPNWDSPFFVDAGAATFGNGTSGISGFVNTFNTLFGIHDNDQIGSYGLTELATGNYVVQSPNCLGGAGAVTFGNGETGAGGPVSADNSLVGSSPDDGVGFSVTPLTNGNYVVSSTSWDNGSAVDVGAVTFGSGDSGISGVVSATNSLVGSTQSDQVGARVTSLANGNYVVSSPLWDNGVVQNAGAATLVSGTSGLVGEVSSDNSLVGDDVNDRIGDETSGSSITELTNGNFVVRSSSWHNDALASVGAVTFVDASVGTAGFVTAENSLVGSQEGDAVGSRGVLALANGNYVVSSPFWSNAAGFGGNAPLAGAATFGNGTTGISGVISEENSLIGVLANSSVSSGGVRGLPNGNYVVISPSWDSIANPNAGAVSFGNGETGVKGVATILNSLIGDSPEDQVGSGNVIPLANGNYVVVSPFWNNGAATAAGAVTLGDGETGITNTVVSPSNSLVGDTTDDHVGLSGVTALPNGNYVVRSALWDRGAVVDAGAATFGSGTTGVTGVVSSANSLVGTQAGDQVGGNNVQALTNGNFVVSSASWHNGDAANAGAVTFGNGKTGIKGAVSASNSLVGSKTNDYVGGDHAFPLANGNYLVWNSSWDHGDLADAGALTFGRGDFGVKGTINSFNSAIGETEFTQLMFPGIDNLNQTFFGRFIDEGPGIVRVGSQIDGFNAPTVVANFGGDKTYLENAPAILLTTTVTVSDVDSANFAGGEVRINFKTGGSADDRLRIRNEGTGTGEINVQGSQVRFGTIVLGTFIGGVGTAPLVVKLTNQATAFRVRQLLRNVVFYNVSDRPVTAARTVRVTVSDGDGETSAAVFKKISVTAVNDKPVLSFSGTVGYVHDKPAITLAPFASVDDVDSPNFSGGRLRVRITDGTSNSNRLAIGAGFTVDANDNVLLGTTIIGKRVSNGFGTNELIITFNTNATPARVQELVRAITFKTVGGAAGQRKVIFTVSDGDGGLSEEAVKRVDVT